MTLMSTICVTGGPRTGKTTFAERVEQRTGIPARHSDTLIQDLAWSDASAEVAKWFDEPGPWLIEGVAVVRALRKWLLAHPEGKPCDRVLFLVDPVVEQTPGQKAMAKGCATIWGGIVAELRARGVVVSVGFEDLEKGDEHAA